VNFSFRGARIRYQGHWRPGAGADSPATPFVAGFVGVAREGSVALAGPPPSGRALRGIAVEGVAIECGVAVDAGTVGAVDASGDRALDGDAGMASPRTGSASDDWLGVDFLMLCQLRS
jgi:hypothetical protein